MPAVAPAIGQGVILLAGWRAVFWMLLAMAVIAWVWFALRQPETLSREARIRFSLHGLWLGLRHICGIRAAVAYTIAAGLIFGAFLGFLSSAQQIFQGIYGTGEAFPAWFAGCALCFGIASVVNARLVMRLGMRYLTIRSVLGLTGMSGLFLVLVLVSGGVPPFWSFMVWLAPTFFCLGIAFGNKNALAMEPLGDMAGLGAAVVGAVSTLVALPLGWLIGQGFDGGLTALVTGFTVLGALCAVVIGWAERAPKT